MRINHIIKTGNVVTQLSDEEREKKSWELIFDYLKQATPAQWHIYVANSNYDGNAQGLNWLANNAQLDRASAIMMYWSLGAAWYVQYAEEEELPEHEQNAWQLIKTLESRCLNGFYADHGIWFDAMHSDRGRADNYPHLIVKRPTPESMLVATAGREYVELEDDKYDEGLPLALAEQIFALYEI